MGAALLRRSATGIMLWEKRNVYPVCFNERELDKAELVQNAELQGVTPLMEFAGDQAMTFTD
jgi:hypothetical protein